MINLLLSSYEISSNWFTDWFYDPEFFFGIQKYAVCILTGVILAYFICTKEGKRMGINKDDVLVCVTIIVPLAIVGARIWYMVGDGYSTTKTFINEFGFFKGLWYTILEFVGYNVYAHSYQGIAGLAIHGGVAVAAILVVICSRWKKWELGRVVDMTAPGLLIGQICGRWGNFFNQEAHGMIVGGCQLSSDGSTLIANLSIDKQYELLTKKYLILPFIAKNMRLSGEEYYYGIVDGVNTYGYFEGENFFHPTFLYESLLNLLGLGIYFILRRRKFVRSGEFGAFYFIWYGIVRFFIEIVRTDSLYIPHTSLKMAQVTSILSILLGIFLIIYFRFIKKNPRYIDCLKNQAINEREEKETVEVINMK